MGLRKVLEFIFGVINQPSLGPLKTIRSQDLVNLSGQTEEAIEGDT